MVKHLLSYLSEEDGRNVLIYHQKQPVEVIHMQMPAHYWEKSTGYDLQRTVPVLGTSAPNGTEVGV